MLSTCGKSINLKRRVDTLNNSWFCIHFFDLLILMLNNSSVFKQSKWILKSLFLLVISQLTVIQLYPNADELSLCQWIWPIEITIESRRKCKLFNSIFSSFNFSSIDIFKEINKLEGKTYDKNQKDVKSLLFKSLTFK